MLITIVACTLLVVVTTILHYEVLRWLNAGVPFLDVPPRSKVVVVILGAFVAHLVEIALYGGVLYGLVAGLGIGDLSGRAEFSWAACLYFSAETYTSLGFGDLTPHGPIRMVAGIEALNGLLLIGWTASYTYISMERFWRMEPPG